MKIHGLQKVTLLDFPGEVACTVFTGGCNLRCPFCHNASLVLPEAFPEAVDEEALFAFLRKRRGVLDGVAVTGGEPLLYPDAAGFLARIRELGYRIKLDTNGSFPARLRQIVEAGLVDRVAMDIKNSPEKYAETVGVPGFDVGPVKESAAFLLSGAVPFEFRTTVVRPLHQAEDFEAIGRWIRGDEEYYLQTFTDSGELLDGAALGPWDGASMEKFAETARAYVPHTYLRGI